MMTYEDYKKLASSSPTSEKVPVDFSGDVPCMHLGEPSLYSIALVFQHLTGGDYLRIVINGAERSNAYLKNHMDLSNWLEEHYPDTLLLLYKRGM